jgi:hypothetical protein
VDHADPPGGVQGGEEVGAGLVAEGLLGDLSGHHDRRCAGGEGSEGAFYQLAQGGGVGEGLGDQAGGLDAAAEGVLAGAVLVVDQLGDRDAHVGGFGVQEEDQAA